MFCTKCGRKVEENHSFCPFCGTRIEKENSSGAAPSGKVSGQAPDDFSGKNGYTEGFGNGTLFRVEFIRPSRLTASMNAIRITVDQSTEIYKLANGKTMELRLSPGTHQFTFSIFGMPQKTKLAVQIDKNRRLTCYPAAKMNAVNPLLIKPVIIEDENGQKLK
ncbi:MAG: zinc-ribbon domain-containing protein [Lachnospiraceae bacterium]|nr:zinc-ribbon domain-containing protein [Lachnospiraceae bacterium]